MRSLLPVYFLGLLSAILFLTPTTVHATTCTPGSQSKFVGLKTQLKQIKNYNESPRNRFVISGTVEIVDGCKFVVRDFQFPNNLPATWYGKDLKETEGYRIIQGVIAPSNGEDKIFTLSDTPGNAYDWNDFDTLTIFYKDNVYAEAHFAELEPGSNYNKPPNSSKSSSSSGNFALLSQSIPTSSPDYNLTNPHSNSDPDHKNHLSSGTKDYSSSNSGNNNKDFPSNKPPPRSSSTQTSFRYSPALIGMIAPVIFFLW